MKKIIVNGGLSLRGKVVPQGSKNAALPILFATLLTDGVSVLRRVPEIGDVEVAIRILKSFGASVIRDGECLIVDTRSLKYTKPDSALTSKIRASSYLIGASLGRFGLVEIAPIGGCDFDKRPIDMHLAAAAALGVERFGDTLSAKKLVGGEITFDKVSVGATINAILMASVAEGKTVIKGGAREPHVLSLAEFLISAGADIAYDGDKVFVTGRPLRGGNYTVIPDMIEAGTYLSLAPLTDGEITVEGNVAVYLDAFLNLFKAGGASVTADSAQTTFRGNLTAEINVKTEPYPGYPTDLQPQLCPLMARFFGGSIEETVWRGRFGYLEALSRFGVGYTRYESFAKIHPSELKGASVQSPDLRGGAACLMAALAAKGKSEIYMPEVIMRGYESLEEKLSSLGADVKIVD